MDHIAWEAWFPGEAGGVCCEAEDFSVSEPPFPFTHHRMLASSSASSINDTGLENVNANMSSVAEYDQEVAEHNHFESLVMLLIFLLLAWIVGKVVMRVRIPSLFGEIVVGMVFGPYLLDIVPYPHALSLFGEVGLVLLVVEAGLEVDIQMLKQIGMRGLVVAVMGSVLPLGVGTGLSLAVGLQTMEALAVGASLAPTSMAIALNVLKAGKGLNTPTGQLIVAAAVIDDVIALILLSEIKAMQGGSDPVSYVTPVVSSLAFILGLGAFALVAMPRIVKLQRVRAMQTETFVFVSFFTMFCLAIGLMNACYYAKSSYLLGAFLAGLCFCTVSNLKPVWHNQVKRVETWMLRLFFAATIAFEVPVKDLWKPNVLKLAAILTTVLLCKVATGIFAPPPLKWSEFLTVGCAMAAWGEFAFVVASTSLDLSIMSKDVYSSVVMAVLVSVIISPWALSLLLIYSRRVKQNLGLKAAKSILKENGVLRHLYLECDVCCKNRWGLIDGLIRRLQNMQLTVIDFTVSTEGSLSVMRLYLKDEEIMLDVKDGNLDVASDYVTSLRKKLCDYFAIPFPEEEDIADGEAASPATPVQETSVTNSDGTKMFVRIAPWHVPFQDEDASIILHYAEDHLKEYSQQLSTGRSRDSPSQSRDSPSNSRGSRSNRDSPISRRTTGSYKSG